MTDLNLDWQFWQSQIDAIKALRSGDFDIVNFQGGYRSGKSLTGARMVLLNALENPGSNNVAMGVSFQEAKKTTFPVLFEQLPKDGDEALDPYLKGGDPEKSPIVKSFSKQDGVLVIKLPGNEPSTISLGSADKASRYEGGSFDFVWMDETGLYKNKLYGIMKTFLERSDQQFWTTTGKTGAQKVIIGDRVDRNGEPINATIKTIRASTMNNPFLSKEKKERLERTYGGTKNAEMALQGGFGSVDGLVYQKFNRVDHVVKREDIELDESWGRVYGYDYGWKDPRCLLCIGKTHSGQLVVLDEFYESRVPLDKCIKWLKEKPKGRIFSEHQPEDINEFRRTLGWTVRKADKDLDAGISTVRQRFEKDDDGKPGLLVTENCEKMIHELNNYQEDDVGGTNTEDHACDVLRYVLRGLEKNDRVGSVGVGSVSAV